MFEVMDQPVKTIDIYKLSEFIDIMSDRTYKNYYYRGESRLYENNICSTMLRDFTKPNKEFLSKYYDDILSEYFREVANNISDIEKEHFIAFCQHHGLKTNLIEFTSSPIIALYFACDMNNEYVKNNIGYMYLVDKDKCIDVSDNLLKNKLGTSLIPFLFDELSHGSNKTIFEFAKVISSYINKDNGEIFYLQNQLKVCCTDLNPETETIQYLKSIITKVNRSDLSENLGILDEIQEKYIKKFNLNEITLKSARDFTILLKLYLDDVISESLIGSSNNFKFPRLPYFIYQTPYKFDRIKNQDAFFVYQLYLSTTSPYMDDIHNNMIQKIEPDVIIRIHDQEKLMKELDSIGINRKMIYGDFDNIAKYFNDKFSSKTN